MQFKDNTYSNTYMYSWIDRWEGVKLCAEDPYEGTNLSDWVDLKSYGWNNWKAKTKTNSTNETPSNSDLQWIYTSKRRNTMEQKQQHKEAITHLPELPERASTSCGRSRPAQCCNSIHQIGATAATYEYMTYPCLAVSKMRRSRRFWFRAEIRELVLLDEIWELMSRPTPILSLAAVEANDGGAPHQRAR